MLRTEGPNALTSNAYAKDFNEVKKVGSLTSTKRTADQTAASIFWQDSGPAIWNRVFRALATSRGSRHRRERPPLCDDEPGCGRRLDRLLERQVLLELLAADHGDPRGRRRDGNPATDGRPGLAAALQPDRARLRAAARHPGLPRPSLRAHLHQRRDRARAARPSSEPTRSPSPRPATNAPPRPARPGASTASPKRSRRSPTPASGAASTSAPPTCKAPYSARKSPTTYDKNYFQPVQ